MAIRSSPGSHALQMSNVPKLGIHSPTGQFVKFHAIRRPTIRRFSPNATRCIRHLAHLTNRRSSASRHGHPLLSIEITTYGFDSESSRASDGDGKPATICYRPGGRRGASGMKHFPSPRAICHSRPHLRRWNDGGLQDRHALQTQYKISHLRLGQALHSAALP